MESSQWHTADESTQFEVLVQSTPSPSKNGFHDPSIDDVVPASDTESISESEDEVLAYKRKRSIYNTPTSKKLTKGRRWGEGSQHHGQHTMFSPQRSKFSNDGSNDPRMEEWQPSDSETLSPVIPRAVDLSSCYDDQSCSQSLLEMDLPTFERRRTKAGARTYFVEEPGSSKNVTCARMETSTPLVSRRNPFSDISNLNITAIKKTHDNRNEIVEACGGWYSEEDDTDEVQSREITVIEKTHENRNEIVEACGGWYSEEDDTDEVQSREITVIEKTYENRNEIVEACGGWYSEEDDMDEVQSREITAIEKIHENRNEIGEACGDWYSDDEDDMDEVQCRENIVIEKTHENREEIVEDCGGWYSEEDDQDEVQSRKITAIEKTHENRNELVEAFGGWYSEEDDTDEVQSRKITAIEKTHENRNEIGDACGDWYSDDEDDMDEVRSREITVIEKRHDSQNKIIGTYTGGNEKTLARRNEIMGACGSEDSDKEMVDEVQSSLESLSILHGIKNSPFKIGRKDKLSDVVEVLDVSDSDSSTPPVPIVKTKKPKKIIVISSSDDEDFKDLTAVKFNDSVDSVNSLFNVNDDFTDDNDELPHGSASKSTFDPREIPPLESARGMSKEWIKLQFKTSVHKTIDELARIIQEMPVPDDDDQVPERPKHLRVELYKHQLYGLKWLYWRENQYPGGGILADEMGLGKTIMMIALVLKSKHEKHLRLETGTDSEEDDWRKKTKDNTKELFQSQCTLVVCPAGMLAQWEAEINTKARHMSVIVFHGPKRKTTATVLAQADFVLTTYQTLGSEIPKDKKSQSVLSRIHWERIILDEGHIIRNKKTIAANAVRTLEANHRWVVTGTPVHNSTKDMFSLVSFLRLDPFSDNKLWDFWIGFKGMNKDQCSRLHTIGKSLLLRRTKEEVNQGDSQRQIPPKTVVDVEVELTLNERFIYDHLYSFAEEKFKTFLKKKEEREHELQDRAFGYIAGPSRPRRQDDNELNFTHMFTLILRLRQASVLPYLIHAMLEDDEVEENLEKFDFDVDIMSLKNPCFKEDFKSAKIQSLLSDINELRDEAEANGSRMDKVIVISQWVKLLDVITIHLMKEGYTVVTITGRQSLDERSIAMAELNSNRRRPEVMCLSLMAGGVGLNLVGANRVFFMDLHWNPQLELQAQDRVHRFGQTKDVKITRYISKDTIDERIVDLQGQKLELADGILNNTKKQKGGGLSIAQMRTLFDL